MPKKHVQNAIKIFTIQNIVISETTLVFNKYSKDYHFMLLVENIFVLYS